jgi:hypothetical protein
LEQFHKADDYITRHHEKDPSRQREPRPDRTLATPQTRSLVKDHGPQARQDTGTPQTRSLVTGKTLYTKNKRIDNLIMESEKHETISKSEEWAKICIHSESNPFGAYGGTRDSLP